MEQWDTLLKIPWTAIHIQERSWAFQFMGLKYFWEIENHLIFVNFLRHDRFKNSSLKIDGLGLTYWTHAKLAHDIKGSNFFWNRWPSSGRLESSTYLLSKSVQSNIVQHQAWTICLWNMSWSLRIMEKNRLNWFWIT